eukprot:2347818-Amphidinium_carterae.1
MKQEVQAGHEGLAVDAGLLLTALVDPLPVILAMVVKQNCLLAALLNAFRAPFCDRNVKHKKTTIAAVVDPNNIGCTQGLLQIAMRRTPIPNRTKHYQCTLAILAGASLADVAYPRTQKTHTSALS